MATTDTTPAIPLSPGARVDHVFPTLTSAQIARIAAHGTVRSVQAGEVLIEEGRQEVPFFVVKAGQIEIVRRSNAGEAIVAVHRPGQFTGKPTCSRTAARCSGRAPAKPAKRSSSIITSC